MKVYMSKILWYVLDVDIIVFHNQWMILITIVLSGAITGLGR